MLSVRLLALILGVAIVPAAFQVAFARDSICPNTNASVKALGAAMQQSPKQPTKEIANAATTAYQAYVTCGKRYKASGDLSNYVYAIAQSGPMFEFAGHAYQGIGNNAMARSALHYGETVLRQAAATGAGSAKSKTGIAQALKDFDSLLGQFTPPPSPLPH